jgi:hypothetical protein
MIASTRRTRRTRSTIAVVAALSLGLAACGGDEEAPETEDAEVEAPADDGAIDDEPAVDGAEDPQAAPGFEDLEEGEIVPGVYLDVPVDETFPVQAQPTPVGSAYVAAMTDQTGAVSLNVEFEGQSLDELLSGIDDLVEAGQAEVAEGPDEIEVDGADEASRVELAAPEGGATATGIFAIADGNAISLAIEVIDESDIDVEAIIDSLRIDPERLQMAGTAETPEAPDGAADGGVEDGAADAGTDETAPEDGTGEDATDAEPADDDADATDG